MTEILSRRDWLLASIFGESPPPETVSSLHATIEALAEALKSITSGSTIRVYGAVFTAESGERRDSVALTGEQREKLVPLHEKGWLDE